MTIPRRTLFGLAGALALLACSERREAPTENVDGPSFAARAGQGAQHITANGRGMYFVSFFDDGIVYGDISVDAADARDSTAGFAPVVFLYYSSSTCQVSDGTCTYRYGYGSVPTGVLSGSANGERVSLDVDPADYPSTFFSYGDPIGPIHVTLTGNGLSSDRTTGTYRSVCSPTACPPNGFSRHWNGVSESSSALTTGTVGSSALPLGTLGFIRSFRNVTLTFQH